MTGRGTLTRGSGKGLLNETIVQWHKELGSQGCLERIIANCPQLKNSERSLRSRISVVIIRVNKAKTQAEKNAILKSEFKGPENENITTLTTSLNNNHIGEGDPVGKGLRPRRKHLNDQTDEDSNDSSDSFGGRATDGGRAADASRVTPDANGTGSRTSSGRRAARVNYNVKDLASSKTSLLYDADGRLVNCGGLNLCDCLDAECPGCHFPCLKCGSEKCGSECRSRRKWIYDFVEIEGKDLKLQNPSKAKS